VVTKLSYVKRASYSLSCPLIASGRDTTKFLLGMETVISIDDGGLGIRYNTGSGVVQFQPGGIRPVLSLEVYHLKSSSNNI
jgi:hypothetical protein